VGVPPKATSGWLKSVGFTSSNDATLISVLKFVDLIDSSASPTNRWKQYRGANHQLVLGDAVSVGHKDLYSIYPDAQSRNKTELAHVFSTSTNAGQQVVSKTLATFKALCDEAKFSNHPIQPDETLQETKSATTGTPSSANIHSASKLPLPNVHIDIQVHIAPESTPEQIETIFKSMAKHLYGKKTEE
jgi:Family of unknown function (DUF5343)